VDSLRQIRRIGGQLIRGQMDDQPQPLLQRKFIDGIDDICFRILIEVSFVERRRIERVEELLNPTKRDRNGGVGAWTIADSTIDHRFLRGIASEPLGNHARSIERPDARDGSGVAGGAMV
jgi:hypothetical protein